jgi:two-component system nitrate/nitrite response regulator NarL
MRVAIADDSDLLRDRVRTALLGIGNIEIVGEARNGIEALQLLADKDPDYLIMDIRMPGMNGISVLERSRELDTKCKICIMTSYPFKFYREKCFAEGAHYFIDKNLDFEKMIKIFHDLSTRGVALLI